MKTINYLILFLIPCSVKTFFLTKTNHKVKYKTNYKDILLKSEIKLLENCATNRIQVSLKSSKNFLFQNYNF